MTAVLCVVSDCREYGWHRVDCVYGPDSDSCRGCLPREAAAGLLTCWIHRDGIAQDAGRAHQVWLELEYRLLPVSGGLAEGVSGTKDRGLRLDPAAVECRADIAAKLYSWADLIVEQRGWTPPVRSVGPVAEFLAGSATWLAAHPSAADAVAELHELAWGRAWRVAYPSGVRTHTMNHPCPVDGCTGTLKAIFRHEASLLPKGEIVCDSPTPGHQRWPASEWLGLRDGRVA